jgi:hypothetical protein
MTVGDTHLIETTSRTRYGTPTGRDTKIDFVWVGSSSVRVKRGGPG